MSVAKKLLLIMQVNQVLAYVHNNKTKYVDFGTQNKKLIYNDKYQHFNFLYRPGKNQFIQYVFNSQAKNIDLAVWSNLDNQILQPFCQKYFGRYFRQLLFIMGTNRALYSKNTTQRHQPLKIRIQLDNVYNKFPGYTPSNTLILSTQQNLSQKHIRNNVIIPKYNPKMPNFDNDVGGYALKKYIQGILVLLQDKKLQDIRTITDSRQSKFIFNRLSHSTYEQKKYI